MQWRIAYKLDATLLGTKMHGLAAVASGVSVKRR